MRHGNESGRGGRRARGVAPALLLALTLLAAAVGPATRPAAAAPALRLDAAASFGGNYQPGEWAPIVVRLANDGTGVTGEAVVEVPATGAGGGARYVQRVELPTRSQKTLTLYAFLPGNPGAVNVSFTSGKDTIGAPPVALRPLKAGQRLIGVLSDDPRASGELARALLGAYGGAVETVAVAADELPDNPYGLGSLAALVLSDAATGRWSAEQRRSLAGWVARGGRLVAAGGPNWRKTAEGLGELPPLRPTDSRAARGLGGLDRLAPGGGPDGAFVVATGDLLPGAEVLAEGDGLPLVARRGWGKGTVAALAFDPATADFARWPGAGAFWRTFALDTPPSPPLHEPFKPVSPGASYAGGVRAIDSVLQDLPALRLPPTWLLLLVMLAFIVAVGPLNYLLLRRLDRRDLAWATIPLLTLLFAGGIYGAGAATRGRSTVVNTVSLVRIVPGARAAELQSFYGVFAPSRGTRQLPLGGDALLTGFSDDGLGAGALGDDARFEQGASVGVRDAAFSQWTLSAAAAQAIVDPAPLALRLELRPEGGKIVGTVANPTGRAVEDVTLLLDGAFHRVGNLDPGAGAAVDWTPAGSPIRTGLGYTLYGGVGQGNNGQPVGVEGRRAEILDTLSGSVLATGAATGAKFGAGAPYATPTLSPTLAPAGGAAPPAALPAAARPAARPAAGTLQVLSWRPDAPLELRMDAGERVVTTLVIQETFLDPARQADGAPPALFVAGGAP